MRFDALAVSRHRWFVVMIMMVGGLMILLAGGNYYLLREHIASIDPSRYGAEGKRLVEELDLRMAMGTAVMVCFILGVFLF
nr:hypothetical protein [Planctomycetota bacterium]